MDDKNKLVTPIKIANAETWTKCEIHDVDYIEPTEICGNCIYDENIKLKEKLDRLQEQYFKKIQETEQINSQVFMEAMEELEELEDEVEQLTSMNDFYKHQLKKLNKIMELVEKSNPCINKCFYGLPNGCKFCELRRQMKELGEES